MNNGNLVAHIGFIHKMGTLIVIQYLFYKAETGSYPKAEAIPCTLFLFRYNEAVPSPCETVPSIIGLR